MKNLKFTLKAWPVIAIATIGLCFLTVLFAKSIGWDLKPQANVLAVRKMGLDTWYLITHWPFGKALTHPAAINFLTNVFLIVIAAPMIEEMIFRFPTRFVWKWKTHFIYTSLIASALFSAAHYLTQPWPDNAFLALFFFGLAQCRLYKKTNIWCAMLNHSLFNSFNLVLLFTLPEKFLQ